jgi:hypothetical protein
MGGMEKTTVYLTIAQKEALARTAAAEGRSEALLIRAGVDVVTAGHRAAEHAPGLAPSAAAAPAEAPPHSTPTRPRWLAREAFVRDILARQADPGLRDELRDLAPDATDELPIR